MAREYLDLFMRHLCLAMHNTTSHVMMASSASTGLELLQEWNATNKHERSFLRKNSIPVRAPPFTIDQNKPIHIRLKKLKKVGRHKDHTSCNVCLAELMANETVAVLPCKHFFH